MGIQNWSVNIVLVNLVKGPETEQDLKDVVVMASEKGWACHIVVNFSEIKDFNFLCSSLVRLLELRKLLKTNGQELVICSCSSGIKDVFRRTGLEDFFQFEDDQSLALSGLV